MGKRYYCEYCDKTMVSAPAIVRTHNNGVLHQKLVREHYHQYKDPEMILSEEAFKKPCLRFQNGECKFGGICRYSHYSREEIDALREYVACKKKMDRIKPPPSFHDLYQKLQDEKAKSEPDNNTTVLYDSNGLTHSLPWTYNNLFDSYGENLPPSLKRMKMDDFKSAEFTEWG
ncbi:zinc finger matrin-type protein 5 [Ostrinia furnacalis]|uniref:zinc finger matrin-type protein 5 n=1 Tax=Ostrinia furnacalis TaxID=93504 RepID=UPI00103C0962|nr:zinc finger matrin-type protein 5 [Ostrinia furnacalis]XP_028174735.1 zinc finger matrin-type protein 5 [Ostrinia furnacalis]